MAKICPIFNNAQFINGIPASGAKLFFYANGSSTKQTTYTDEDGTTPQANPIILNARGEPASPIFLTEGLVYKGVLAPSTDTDPPSSAIRTVPDLTGIGDSSVTLDQWVDSGVTPTYVNATQFTLPGDQTSAFQVNRRIKATVTAGTVYGYISVSSFAALTTITVVLDSGSLDEGLSAVQLGLLTPQNSSLPAVSTAQILDLAVTNAKLAANSVTASKLAADAILRGHLAGLGLSTAGSSATMDFAAGQAADSTSSVLMALVSAISKTTGAWAVGTGNGGLDTGTIANNTGYHWYLIRRQDTGVVDVLCSLSASAPTLPTNYTQFRRIGWGKTNGTAQWLTFTQVGDEFYWSTPVLDFFGAGSTTATLLSCSLPSGVKVKANFNVQVLNGGAAQFTYISDPDNADLATSVSFANPLASHGVSAGGAVVVNASGQVACWTNTSGQIRHRETATPNVGIATLGWIDTRGRDA